MFSLVVVDNVITKKKKKKKLEISHGPWAIGPTGGFDECSELLTETVQTLRHDDLSLEAKARKRKFGGRGEVWGRKEKGREREVYICSGGMKKD